MAALKMRERTLAGSSGIDLARALVVDDSWNQLNKLTQLMEMIMYLQEWNLKRLKVDYWTTFR